MIIRWKPAVGIRDLKFFSCFLHGPDKVIGLAYVPPTLAGPGSPINIKIDDGRIVKATVVTTPFYDPDNERQKVQRGEEMAT